MIDTDAYERILKEEYEEEGINNVFALDLLAEVKRLRGKLESIQSNMAWTVIVWLNENYMERQEWMEQMCEVYADLAKGIEAQYHGDEEE